MGRLTDYKRCNFCKQRFGNYAGTTATASHKVFNAEDRATISVSVEHCGHFDCEMMAEQEAEALLKLADKPLLDRDAATKP